MYIKYINDTNKKKLQKQFNIQELVIKKNLGCFGLVFTQPNKVL